MIVAIECGDDLLCAIHGSIGAERLPNPRRIVSCGAGYQKGGKDEQKQEQGTFPHTVSASAVLHDHQKFPPFLRITGICKPIVSELLCFVNTFSPKKTQDVVFF
jgi:hypothetical protein